MSTKIVVIDELLIKVLKKVRKHLRDRIKYEGDLEVNPLLAAGLCNLLVKAVREELDKYSNKLSFSDINNLEYNIILLFKRKYNELYPDDVKQMTAIEQIENNNFLSFGKGNITGYIVNWFNKDTPNTVENWYKPRLKFINKWLKDLNDVNK
jgi:hypothetical protein